MGGIKMSGDGRELEEYALKKLHRRQRPLDSVRTFHVTNFMEWQLLTFDSKGRVRSEEFIQSHAASSTILELKRII
jgi:hypothetical protein